MRIAIIDDIQEDREHLKADVSRWATERRIPLIPAPALYESGEGFLENFSAGQYDIIFLDIYMDGINGMDTARLIRKIDKDCRLIFTTTTAEFAVDSYEVESSWYLVKPYRYDTLLQALNRCCSAFLEQGQFLTVPGRNGLQKLLLHHISWTEYINRHVCVHFKNGSTTDVSLRQMEFSELLLAYPYFCDCMKGILVNFEMVEKLSDNCFLLKDGTMVPISRLKYREVREKFLEYCYAKAREETL